MGFKVLCGRKRTLGAQVRQLCSVQPTLFFITQQRFDRFDELLNLDRFRKNAGDAQLTGASQELMLLGVSRNGNQRQIGELTVDDLDRLQTIHVWHYYIGNYKVELLFSEQL